MLRALIHVSSDDRHLAKSDADTQFRGCLLKRSACRFCLGCARWGVRSFQAREQGKERTLTLKGCDPPGSRCVVGRERATSGFERTSGDSGIAGFPSRGSMGVRPVARSASANQCRRDEVVEVSASRPPTSQRASRTQLYVRILKQRFARCLSLGCNCVFVILGKLNMRSENVAGPLSRTLIEQRGVVIPRNFQPEAGGMSQCGRAAARPNTKAPPSVPTLARQSLQQGRVRPAKLVRNRPHLVWLRPMSGEVGSLLGDVVQFRARLTNTGSTSPCSQAHISRMSPPDPKIDLWRCVPTQ